MAARPRARLYSTEYARTGFQGGLQWYRCGTWANSPPNSQPGQAARSTCPPVSSPANRTGAPTRARASLRQCNDSACTRMLGCHLVDGAGHWVQQEQPEQVVHLLLQFLKQAAEHARPVRLVIAAIDTHARGNDCPRPALPTAGIAPGDSHWRRAIWKRRSLDFWERWRRSGHSTPPRPRRLRPRPTSCGPIPSPTCWSRSRTPQRCCRLSTNRARSVGERKRPAGAVYIEHHHHHHHHSQYRRYAPRVVDRAAAISVTTITTTIITASTAATIEVGRHPMMRKRDPRVPFFCAARRLAGSDPLYSWRAFSFAARCRCR